VDRVLGALAARGTPTHKNGQGWLAHCPAHQDKVPSLSISEGQDGRALVKCFAGCTPESIVAALGLKMTDLFNDPLKTARCEALRSTKEAGARESQGPQTLEAFCAVRKLDIEFLEKTVKAREETIDGRPAIVYPVAGGLHRIKFLGGTAPKYRWKEKGGKPYWYGLSRAKTHGNACLYLTNGEVSVWAADSEGVPACCTLGGEGFVPAPEMVKELADSGFERIRVVFDLDEAGRKGARQTVKALLDGGLKDVKALELPSTLGLHGDLDDLHRRVGAGLKAALEALPPLPEAVPPGPVTKQFSTVEPEEVTWLWEPYIPKGKLVLFQGDPAAGKTWAALNFAARLTKQGHKVLYGSLEDGLADTLRPRAEKVGADLTKMIALTGRRDEDGTERPLTLMDVDIIEAALAKEKPALLVLDPISAWLQGADMNKANEVRGKLTPMVALAEKYSVTVLILQHLTKAKTDRAIYRGSGSIDFVAACRSALLFGETQSGQRAMAQVKNSFAPLGRSVGYSIDAEGFTWTGEVDLTAADLLQGEASPEEKGASEDALEWLREALANGPQEAGPLQQRFERETGHNRRTLRRAFKSMGGRSYKDDFSAGWKWTLDEGDTTPTKGTGTQNRVPFDETTATKGLQGQRSTEGDTEKRVCPLRGPAVPFGEAGGKVAHLDHPPIDDTKRESVAYGGPAVVYDARQDPNADPELKLWLKKHPEFMEA
jgi:KaiC/GvpD/RAD55 family RecA-like ATPase